MKPCSNHMMIDIETLGNGANALIVVDAYRQAEAVIRANLKLKDKAYGNPMRFSAMPMV